jgi:hypothetical protein
MNIVNAEETIYRKPRLPLVVIAAVLIIRRLVQPMAPI